MAELGRSEVLSEDAGYAAAHVLARQCIAGEFTTRQIADWAHRHLGHEVDDPYGLLVDADDDYDLCDTLCHDPSDIDAEVLSACRQLVEIERRQKSTLSPRSTFAHWGGPLVGGRTYV